tara:strand:+ start:398 stop:1282 length:885 start_codon:yes stop_codon:yes gene_type:complete
MSRSRSSEIRFWWPLSLAALVWLIIIWAFGFYLETPKKEIVTPPPIEARFLDLPESELKQKPVPLPRKTPKTRPQVKPNKPKLAENKSKLKHKPQPHRRKLPPTQPQVKPETLEKLKPWEPLSRKQTVRPKTPPDTTAGRPTDLSEYIEQARARRHAAGIFDGIEDSKAVTSKRQPSEDEIRMAKIKRNLQAPGTSGLFNIVQIGTRIAQFSFRSWKTDSSNTRRELINVEAGPDGDIHRAIIRRMIELIRQHHQHDFNWESHRLNSVVVLSARIEDNQRLEDFLMREFFSYIR